MLDKGNVQLRLPLSEFQYRCCLAVITRRRSCKKGRECWQLLTVSCHFMGPMLGFRMQEEGHLGLKFSGQPFKNGGAFFVGKAGDVVGYIKG